MIKLFIGPDPKRPAPPPDVGRCPRCGSTAWHPAFIAHSGKRAIVTEDDRVACNACGHTRSARDPASP